MSTSETINKANPLKPAEDYNKLRRDGIVNIEKLAGNVWTDYNTHDPGITLLEALCYAITDLAYRTGFDMKDILAQKTLSHDSWKNIFYTARQILPCNPLTINDYRKLIIDIEGVRNAWITISKDYEVPVFMNNPDSTKFGEILVDQVKNKTICCEDKIKLQSEDYIDADEIEYGLNFKKGNIVELNGLYKIIIEYEEEILEKNKQEEIRLRVLKELHKHRNLCEDYLSITGAEYHNFFLDTELLLDESADPEMVLAEICYRIQNYFTPPLKFYSLDEMVEKGKSGEEIFDGPLLDHGFVLDEEIERTDLFRDMHLSDIINQVSDVDGITALNRFKLFDDDLVDSSSLPPDDRCQNEKYFDEWIVEIKNRKLVGQLSIEDVLKVFHPPLDENELAKSKIAFKKPSGEVEIDTDRFEKLLNDLKGHDKFFKLKGFKNNFDVPSGESRELDNFYPVQYTLPFNYRVGEAGLPLKDGKKRLMQSLQLKGYLAVFEQLFLNYMKQLGSLNEIFSFNEIKYKGKSKHKPHQSACDPIQEKKEKDGKVWLPEDLNQPNYIIYKDETNQYKERIAGYLQLFSSVEDFLKDKEKDTRLENYLSKIEEVIQPESEFEWQRNKMLNHLLARFGEEMREYESLLRYLYPGNYLTKLIKNKTDLLSDYQAISNYRSRAYNYKLEEEYIDYEDKDWDEKKIANNISGLEKRIARLIGLPDYDRKNVAPDSLFVEKQEDTNDDNYGMIKAVLYEDRLRNKVLLETEYFDSGCEDELIHRFIEAGCCVDNFKISPDVHGKHHRVFNQLQGFRFYLVDNDHEPVAHSPKIPYKTVELRDEALQAAKCNLEKICHSEGLHLIEHILLRPKGDFSVSNKSKKEPVETKYGLLNICIDKCDLNVVQDEHDKSNFRFDIEVLPPERCRNGKRWLVTLTYTISPGDEIQFLNKSFVTYEEASYFISKLREYGSEMDNFEILRTKVKDGKSYFYFKLYNFSRKTYIESFCFERFSEAGTSADAARLGGRNTCRNFEILDKEVYPIVADKGISELIVELKDFFTYELDLYCCEESCNNNVDPYSFRISFVLPCWTKRFRNKGFRKFVEKTIYAETPAHIHPKIFWLGIEKMRLFEDAYFNWVIEMAENDIPDIWIANQLVNAVNDLKNCDETCGEKVTEETASEGALPVIETPGGGAAEKEIISFAKKEKENSGSKKNKPSEDKENKKRQEEKGKAAGKKKK